jgi:hypothetical protein
LQPWVWDDRGADSLFERSDRNAHHTQAVLDLVDGYRSRGIPVGAVIIDSPWATNYNTFVFDPRRYENPSKLIDDLHARNVRVVLWLTAIMNPATSVFPHEGDFRVGLTQGYLRVKTDQRLARWWKGSGGLIDFDNPPAVQWWQTLMDRALLLGIDGWKVDKVEASLPTDEENENPLKARGMIAPYRRQYFRETYRHLIRHNPEGVVLQRPFYTSTVAETPVAWVGDQTHSWQGLRSAVRLVLGGARVGNAVIGSDIGGYRGGQRPNKLLYLRWAQFGALCPLMETGGEGERRPWKIDSETVQIFRYYAILHTELIPYLYTWMIEHHLSGRPLMKGLSARRGEYLLGPDLFVSAVMSAATSQEVRLPPGEWVDFWDQRKIYRGPARLKGYPTPLARIPFFIRRGAIVPLQTGGRGPSAVAAWGSTPEELSRRSPGIPEEGPLTLAIVPGGSSVLRYRYETGPRLFGAGSVRVSEGPSGVTIAWQDLPQPPLLRVRSTARPAAVTLQTGGRGSSVAGSGPEPATLGPRPATLREEPRSLDEVETGWTWEAAAGQVWVKPGPATSGLLFLRAEADAPLPDGRE